MAANDPERSFAACKRERFNDIAAYQLALRRVRPTASRVRDAAIQEHTFRIGRGMPLHLPDEKSRLPDQQNSNRWRKCRPLKTTSKIVRAVISSSGALIGFVSCKAP